MFLKFSEKARLESTEVAERGRGPLQLRKHVTEAQEGPRALRRDRPRQCAGEKGPAMLGALRTGSGGLSAVVTGTQ